jgi:hypothetical protein
VRAWSFNPFAYKVTASSPERGVTKDRFGPGKLYFTTLTILFEEERGALEKRFGSTRGERSPRKVPPRLGVFHIEEEVDPRSLTTTVGLSVDVVPAVATEMFHLAHRTG